MSHQVRRGVGENSVAGGGASLVSLAWELADLTAL